MMLHTGETGRRTGRYGMYVLQGTEMDRFKGSGCASNRAPVRCANPRPGAGQAEILSRVDLMYREPRTASQVYGHLRGTATFQEHDCIVFRTGCLYG